ncbi:MAG TPA: serine protease [Pyrinomonadaceae bacterium]|nr:serine protease [Pyrinomonadaceae bacterium]
MLNLIPVRLASFLFFAILCSVTVAASKRYSSAASAGPSSEVLARAKRAVVLITTYDQTGRLEKQGSGFFLTADRVVTNLHVVNTASQILISTFTGKTVRADSVLAADETSDLALLQLAAPCSDVATLEPAELEPSQGEPVVLVSNPLGSHWQVSAGEVGRSWNFFEIGERLQITSNVLPGSSGGPVLNLEGNVIGIAVMHVESNDNLNFAVPVARLKALQAATATRRLVRTHKLNSMVN